MIYPLASNTWDQKELMAAINTLASGNHTMGKCVKEFENKFADYVGSKHACMVNSGSSANLLMLSILKYKYGFEIGSDVIVPAVGWSTTYYPIHQNGFKLNFVDINRLTLNIDPDKVESAITNKTKAILAVNLLGNPCEFDKLQVIADKYNLLLLEDNCESFGARYNNRYTGTIGLMGSYSFFFSHHLQTMEGGMIVTDDDDIIQYLRSMRAHGWCRELPDVNPIYAKKGDWFKDHFTFILPGYSIRPLEIEAAVGLVQLEKWKDFFKVRRENSSSFQTMFVGESWCDIQKEVGLSSWYGFSLVFKNKLKGKRDQIAKILIDNGIEIRPIMTGNFMKNPCMKYLDFIDNGNYEVADYIDQNGLFIGNHTYYLWHELELVHNLITEVI